MDKRNNNIRLVGSGGRRVTKNTTEYDWNKLEKKTSTQKQDTTPTKTRGMSELEKKVRHQKMQKEKRLKTQRRRALIILILTTILIIVLMFLTPIFNIRTISVEGNRLVTGEQFQEKLKPLVGENLFRTGGGKIRKSLKTIPYIDTVEVSKRIFPPSLKVIVTEHNPAAIMKFNDKKLLLNSELLVLTDNDEISDPVPILTGLVAKSYKVGNIIKTEDTEKAEIATTALQTLESTGILADTVEINVEDIADIRLNYDNRITVLCGSQLDLERKLRLFKETVTSNSLSDSARGTMDLSETGKAVYTP